MDAEPFFRIAKALSDPRRFDMLARIAAVDELGCQTLVAESEVTQPTVSHHLKELVVAGLVESRREGQFVHYCLRRDVLDAYLRELSARLGAAHGAGAAVP